MKTLVLLCIVLVMGVLCASADTISFTYSGSGFSGAGVFTASDQLNGSWLVTGVNGKQNGIAFSGVEPLGTNGGYNYDNLVFLYTTLQLDNSGILLSWNGGDVNLGYDAGLNGGSYALWNPTEYALQFAASSTPEPGTLLTLGAGILGIALLARNRLFS